MRWDEAIVPRGFDEFVGQGIIRQEIETILAAASILGDRIPHILFYGEYGLGKTTLAKIAASDSGYDLVYGGNYTDDVEVEGSILIIDEIHTIRDSTQLCVLLDDPNNSSVFGCTTDPQELSAALRSRFIPFRLQPYSEVELSQILGYVTGRLPLFCDVDALLEIARRAKGIARISLSYLRRLRDRSVVENTPLTVEFIQHFFEDIGVTDWGLTRDDVAYLSALSRTPMGIQQLASRTGLTEGIILEEVEPFLLRKGLVIRTPRGRILA